MLTPYRVLDLTDERGQLAGYIFASLGADVVLVEPPGGSSARRLPPFAHTAGSGAHTGTPSGDDLERSLTFWGWNRGKRSVVLDLSTVEGADALGRLAADVDVILDSGAQPVDLEALRRQHPHLVTVSISAFGSTGPKADWPATDLTILAAGCQLAMTGDADRAPVRTSVPQAYAHAASDAAAGAMVALTERSASGLGQHVEVAAQRSVLQATQSYILSVPLGGTAAQRASGGVRTGGLDVQLRWPCKDGFVSLTFLFGASMGPFTRRLMHWLHEEGFCDEATRDKDWLDYANQLYDGREPISEFERVKGVIGEFCITKTKAELLEAARSRILLIAPIATPEDVVESSQLAVRDFWEMVADPLLSDRPFAAPGAYVHPTVSPMPALGRAPRLGEHTDEVLARTGAGTGGAAVAPAASGGARTAPLAGIKVLDLTWAMAGPAITRSMADYGAEVIRVEASSHLDVSRTIGPFVNDTPGTDASGLLFNMATGKRSLALNMGAPEARSVLEDLVRRADVVVESFSPRGRAALDLSYERLAEINPSLIMMSTCLFGQTGPLQRYAGFGTMGSALTGFFHLTGWPDRPPCGPFGAYSDYPSPRFALCALLAALDHRRRTGEGQYLDFSQAESCAHFLSSALLDYTVNGHNSCRDGNRDPVMAPHGVYRAAGEDRWVAVACATDEQWGALTGLLGRTDLAGLSNRERHERADELDRLIEAWTQARSPDEAQDALIAAGIAAHAVNNSAECAVDPQLADHFVTLPHPEHGTIVVEGSRLKLSATPAVVQGIPPVLGQDTVEVITEILGYSDDKMGDLFGAGALE